jgi:hypothetical protein
VGGVFRTHRGAVAISVLLVGAVTVAAVAESKNQSILLDIPASASFGESLSIAAASATSGLPLSVELIGGPCTLDGRSIAATGVGVCTFRATQLGDGWRNPITLTRTLSISKADQSLAIVGALSAAYGDPPLAVNASSSAKLPVALSASGSCALDGTKLMIQRAGPCVVRATQHGDEYFNQATRDLTVNVSKASQSISFEPLPAGGMYGGGPFTVSAQASSGGAVAFTATGACTVSGTVVSIQAAGVCTVSANQPGGDNWMPSSTVIRTLMIAKANQQIRVAVPDPIRYGGSSVGVDATSSASIAVGLTAAGPCTLTGGLVKAKGFIGTDVCTITATQSGDANVNPANPVIQRVT